MTNKEHQNKLVCDEYEVIIKYRYEDDPEDMIREAKPTFEWKEELQAYELLPASPRKRIII